MFYLIETSKEGRIRKLRKGSKWAMEQGKKAMDSQRTTAIHKFKSDNEAMGFIRAHNGAPQPSTRFTSVPQA